MLPLQNEQGLIARVMEEKMVGVIVTRNEDDGKFSMDSLDKALRPVVQKNEGKVYRSKAEEIVKYLVSMSCNKNI